MAKKEENWDFDTKKESGKKSLNQNSELKAISKNLNEINANLNGMANSLTYISYAALLWIALTIIGLFLFVYFIAALTAPTEVIEPT